jgi:large subunit ribosomal protein L27
MSTTKSTGATKLGRDSNPKYLGIKVADGQIAKVGNVIVRQRGTRFVAGKNVKQGSDDTLYAMAEGKVKITSKNKIKFDGSRREIKVVSVG